MGRLHDLLRRKPRTFDLEVEDTTDKLSEVVDEQLRLARELERRTGKRVGLIEELMSLREGMDGA